MLQKIRHWFQQKSRIEAIHLLKHQVNSQLSQNDLTAAEQSLQQILELDSNEEETLVTLSKVLRQQKKLDQGYAILQKAITLNAEHTRFIIDFVQGYEEAGAFAKMREILDMAIQQAPNMVEWRLYLAQHLFENASLQEAEAELVEILKREPHHLEANIGLTHCYINAGLKAKALAQVSKIHQWDKQSAEALISAIYENVQNFN